MAHKVIMTDKDKDCKTCNKRKQGWKECGGKLHYSFSDINFCWFQMIWLISNLLVLGEDKWPEDPLGGSDVDLPLKRRRIGHEAYYCKPREILAETMLRLNKCGSDGTTLIEEIHSGLDMELLSSVAKSALYYVSGWARKEMPYRAWGRQQRYRLKQGRLYAGQAVSKSIKEGGLQRPGECSACGKGGRIVGHHPDYSKPLDVIWLCQSCHNRLRPNECESVVKRG